jgi:type VI protein secretion system component Hcp
MGILSPLRRGLGLSLLATLLTAGNGSAEIVMRVDGVDGETCFTPGHDKWICVLATSVGAATTCSSPAGSATRDCARPVLTDFTATIYQTSASPQLLGKLLAGEPILKVEVEWWSVVGQGTRVKTASLLLEDVFLTSLSSSASEDRPVENVSFVYAKVTSMVWPVLPDGKTGDPQKTCWDIVMNKPC